MTSRKNRATWERSDQQRLKEGANLGEKGWKFGETVGKFLGRENREGAERNSGVARGKVKRGGATVGLTHP